MSAQAKAAFIDIVIRERRAQLAGTAPKTAQSNLRNVGQLEYAANMLRDPRPVLDLSGFYQRKRDAWQLLRIGGVK